MSRSANSLVRCKFCGYPAYLGACGCRRFLLERYTIATDCVVTAYATGGLTVNNAKNTDKTMTNEEHDYNRDIQDARRTWYLGLVLFTFLLFTEGWIIYQSTLPGMPPVNCVVLAAVVGAGAGLMGRDLYVDRKRLLNAQGSRK